MPALWIAAAGAIANGIGAAKGAKAAKENAAATKKAANQIIKDTDAFEAAGFGLIGDARSNGENYLSGVQYIQPFKPIKFTRSTNPADEVFTAAGTALSNLSFNVQTEQKRANLDFVLGDSANDLRNAQNDFTALAAGDTSAFEKELKASAFGALADSYGSPAGTFGNTSARNLFAFRTEGLRNSLAIGDFFAEQGTVDPVDPLPSIFALAEFEQKEDAEKQALQQFNRTIDFEVARHNSSLSLDVAKTGIGLESLLLGSGLDVLSTGLDYRSNARLIAAQQAGAGQAAAGQAISSIGGSLGQLAGDFSDYRAAQSAQETSKAYASFLGGTSSYSDFI